MNILDQFEQVAYQRLSEHANSVDITKSKFEKHYGVYSYEISAYLDNKLCRGYGLSIGEAIDRCIESLKIYNIEPKQYLQAE